MSARIPPSLAAYMRLSITYRRAILHRWLRSWREHVQGIVLDVGGEKHSLVAYQFGRQSGAQACICLNVSPDKSPDVVADGEHIPFRTGTIGTVVCLETLEHVDNPLQVTRELARVLQPSGVLLLSVPFLYRVHGAPSDFWRFTQYQVERMVCQAGLEIVHMEHLGRLLTVLCDMTKQAISEVRWTALRWAMGIIFLPVAALAVSVESLGERKHLSAISTFTTGYVVMATKLQTPPLSGEGCTDRRV
jgi:SAM-dependent methyltransferase